MNYFNEFNRLMEEHTEMALATCTGNIPNVRVVNFYYDPDRKGTAYFATFARNQKVKEFSANSTVAFTTIPKRGNGHVRANNAVVKKSDMTIFDLQDQFADKIEGYRETIEQAGKQLVLYEISFQEISVTVDMMHRGKIAL
jgi:uncharacterized pyridoxamine 5'-phosphate oxidase family protein